MKASLLVQGPSEDTATFQARLNEELARLGDTVKDVKLSAGVHEVTIGGRLNLPRIISTVLVLYEER